MTGFVSVSLPDRKEDYFLCTGLTNIWGDLPDGLFCRILAPSLRLHGTRSSSRYIRLDRRDSLPPPPDVRCQAQSEPRGQTRASPLLTTFRIWRLWCAMPVMRRKAGFAVAGVVVRIPMPATAKRVSKIESSRLVALLRSVGDLV